MANTQLLKTIIEPALGKLFLQKYEATLVPIKSLLEMDFDLIAYSHKYKMLMVCEITTSGFYGNRGNFHIGANRKLADCFARFIIVHDNTEQIILDVNKSNPNLNVEKVECHFIIPKGAQFISALGWRKKLLSRGTMHLDELEISATELEVLKNVLASAKNEMIRGK